MKKNSFLSTSSATYAIAGISCLIVIITTSQLINFSSCFNSEISTTCWVDINSDHAKDAPNTQQQHQKINTIVSDSPKHVHNSTLKLVQIVFRHGDRTPLESNFYPNDPYKDPSLWPDGFGELTPRGKERMYHLGVQLRKRYETFLSETPKELFVRSSASTRCLETTTAVLAGMYPPKGRWVWSNNSEGQMTMQAIHISQEWQPIAIQTAEKSQDYLLASKLECPALGASRKEVLNSSTVREFMAERQDFIDQVSYYTGEKIQTIEDLYQLSKLLRTEKIYLNEEPEWIKLLEGGGEETIRRLEQFDKMRFWVESSTHVMQRLKAGPMLKELIQNMEDTISSYPNNVKPFDFNEIFSGKARSTATATSGRKDDASLEKKKLYLYGTHGTRIVILMHTLGIYDQVEAVIDFGITLIFELHRGERGENIVKLFYYYDTSREPVQLHIPHCGKDKASPVNPTSDTTTRRTDCTLEEFNNYITKEKDLIPTNIAKECALDFYFSDLNKYNFCHL